jgi:hypothetical protein
MIAADGGEVSSHSTCHMAAGDLMSGLSHRPAPPTGRWSFGEDTILHTRAGVLLPELLIASAGQAVLHGSLSLSGASLRAATVPRPPALLGPAGPWQECQGGPGPYRCRHRSCAGARRKRHYRR